MSHREHLDQASSTPGRVPPAQGASGMDQGMQVLSYLISGVLLYGGAGWLGDHYLGTGFLLPLGIVLGAGFGIYLVIKRFAAEPDGPVRPVRSPTAVRTSSSTEEETT